MRSRLGSGAAALTGFGALIWVIVPDGFLCLGVERLARGGGRLSYVDTKKDDYAAVGVTYYVIYNPEYFTRHDRSSFEVYWDTNRIRVKNCTLRLKSLIYHNDQFSQGRQRKVFRLSEVVILVINQDFYQSICLTSDQEVLKEEAK